MNIWYKDFFIIRNNKINNIKEFKKTLSKKIVEYVRNNFSFELYVLHVYGDFMLSFSASHIKTHSISGYNYWILTNIVYSLSTCCLFGWFDGTLDLLNRKYWGRRETRSLLLVWIDCLHFYRVQPEKDGRHDIPPEILCEGLRSKGVTSTLCRRPLTL